MCLQWHAYDDAEAAASGCASHIAEHLRKAIDERGYAALAISGGSTPKPMFLQLASLGLPWDRVHVFWADERAVPPDDPQSNYRLAAETLLGSVRVPERNIHRILGELEPDAAARAYVRELRQFFGLGPGEMPEFDIVHRGIGPDAHTASLFPDDPLIEDRQGLAAAVYVKKKSQLRITLLPGPLIAARNTALLVTGEDKAEAVRAVFFEPYDPLRYPAQIGTRQGRGAVWFLDRGAARLVEISGSAAH